MAVFKWSPMAIAGWVTGGLVAVGLLGALFPRDTTETEDATATEADSPTSSTPGSGYTAIFTCRTPDNIPVLVMGCFQGRGGSLKINNGSDVTAYSMMDFGQFSSNEQRFRLGSGYRILASVMYETTFTLRLEIEDANGHRVFADEANNGGTILASD